MSAIKYYNQTTQQWEVVGQAASPTVDISGKSDFIYPTYTRDHSLTNAQYTQTMDSGWVDEFSSGVISHDTTTKFSGLASLKIETGTTGAYAGARMSVAYDLSNSDIKLWVRSSNWSNVSIMQIRFYSGGSFYFLDFAQYQQDKVDNEWTEIVLTKGRFFSSGSPSWGNIDKVVFNALSPNGTVANVWIDMLSTFKSANKPAISISFDDSRITAYTKGADYMESKGIFGTMFAIPSLLGQTNHMSQEQIDDLARRGWDISGHGEFNLSTLNDEEMDADVKASALWLNQNGYTGSNLYAYPNGANDNRIRSVVSKYFAYGRTINFINPSLTSMSPMRLNALSPISSWTFAMIKDYIDFAIANNEWCNIVFHNIADTPTVATEISTATFEQVIDYVAGLEVDVLPMSRVLTKDWSTPSTTLTGMGTVAHGATASVARPDGWAIVTWIGSVAPTNASENDIWYNV